MPVLLLAFPYLSDTVLHHPLIEWMVLGLLVFFGAVSLNHYRREHHGNILPLRLFIFGVGLFTCALIIPGNFHHWLAIVGSLVIAGSHGVNLALKRVIAQ
jgi:hypothetical protein